MSSLEEEAAQYFPRAVQIVELYHARQCPADEIVSRIRTLASKGMAHIVEVALDAKH